MHRLLRHVCAKSAIKNHEFDYLASQEIYGNAAYCISLDGAAANGRAADRREQCNPLPRVRLTLK
jgi:hypothetical protein